MGRWKGVSPSVVVSVKVGVVWRKVINFILCCVF